VLNQDDEMDILDLERRLRIYREFSARSVSTATTASQYIASLWDKRTPMYARPLLLGAGAASSLKFFYPPSGVGVETLNSTMQRLLNVLEGMVPEVRVRGAMITLQEKISELTEKLRNSMSVKLRGRIGRHEREEVIVLFLAVLHMLAGRIAEVDQEEAFGEITVSMSDAVN